jgi:hypothetical protein
MTLLQTGKNVKRTNPTMPIFDEKLLGAIQKKVRRTSKPFCYLNDLITCYIVGV